jgi:hypothetical protein
VVFALVPMAEAGLIGMEIWVASDRDVRHLAPRRHDTYVGIAARTGPAFRDHPERYFAADRYHPDEAGDQLWATAVAQIVTGITAQSANATV